MKTSEEHIEELETLVDAFADLAKFHELATVDSRAVELLVRHRNMFALTEDVHESDEDWYKRLCQENSHEMS